VALSLPAAALCWGAWRWLVVMSFAKQKQQLHHQQLTNGSTTFWSDQSAQHDKIKLKYTKIYTGTCVQRMQSRTLPSSALDYPR
jgi:hypothetical protein